MPDVAATLTRKIGPLPLWAWGAIIGGGIVAAKVLSGGGSSSGSSQVLGTSNVPLPDGFDGTGGIGSGPGIAGDIPDVSPIAVPGIVTSTGESFVQAIGQGGGEPSIDEDISVTSPFYGMTRDEIAAAWTKLTDPLAGLTDAQRAVWNTLTPAQQDAYTATPIPTTGPFANMTQAQILTSASSLFAPTAPTIVPTTSET
jgi:hypothetical protein